MGWGDSLTYSLTKTGDGWTQADPTWLQTLGTDLGVATKNFGVMSQGSAEIAVRQGGLKPTVTLAGNQLPKGTRAATQVTDISPKDGWSQYRQAGELTMHGALGDVPGTLIHNVDDGVDSFSFTPDTAPDWNRPVPAGTTFSGDQGDGYRDCIQIIWAGTNNSAQPAAIVRDVAEMVKWIPDPKRFLIVGANPETTAELKANYGKRFVDLQGWLRSDGLTAAGITPTADDESSIAAGEVPSSLRVDGTHLTQAAYTAIGHHLASLVKSEYSTNP
ncbi:hypothetical protein OG976_04860 [Mycobacterium sp. NBC_00419]|uniref:hypothetical protein n=1 Tax=Mycobacterium sp. NBC_00419 TaxID=2975989 RepID=UPI002E1A944F